MGNTFVRGVETFGKDLYSTFSGAYRGGMLGAQVGMIGGPETGIAGAILGGISGAVPGMVGTIKDLVHFGHHNAPESTRGGPNVQQLAESAPLTRAMTFASMANDPAIQTYRRSLAQGMTAGGAFVSSGLSRLPGVMAQGQLNGVFNRAPGANPKSVLLIGNGAMRRAMTGGAMSATSGVVSPFTDAIYGYGHAMASDFYTRGTPQPQQQSSVNTMQVAGGV